MKTASLYGLVLVKTCVFFFVKKREGTEVLEVTKKMSKTHRETGRSYKFTKTHQTSHVKFYDYNPYEEIKRLLVEVPIERIAGNSYSLNYSEYLEEDKEEEQLADGVVMKTLGEVCTFLQKSKRQASYGVKQGAYPFYTSSQTCNKYCDEYDYEDECLILGTGGTANVKCDSKFSCSTDNFVMTVQSEYLTRYMYYYLLLNIDILDKGFTGLGLKHISKDYVKNIQISIPSLERQQEIVDYCEANDALIASLEAEIERNKQQANQLLAMMVKGKTLEENDIQETIGEESANAIEEEQEPEQEENM